MRWMLLSLLLFSTMTKTELIAENAVQIQTYKTTEIAAVTQNEPEAEVIPEEPANVRLWGVCTVTHYCNCSACCGQWAGGGTASGTTPTAGRTVAADLPFGTRLLINGQEYIVEDRGVSGMWVDIYCDSHGEALSRGMYQTEVYIIS